MKYYKMYAGTPNFWTSSHWSGAQQNLC